MPNTGDKYNQSGLVSLMVTAVMVILLSLVTIGFARLMSREVRQSLDNQLGVQANYAAESGINDAIAYIDTIRSGRSIGTSDSTTTCADGNSQVSAVLNNPNRKNLTADGNVQYSCLLIDTQPEYLNFSVDKDKTVLFQFTQPFLSSLLVSWQNKDYNPAEAGVYRNAGDTKFPPTDQWGDKTTGVLKISIFPVTKVPKPGVPEDGIDYRNISLNDLDATYEDDTSRSDIMANTRTYFMYPSKSPIGAPGNSALIHDYSYKNLDGSILDGRCNDSHTSISETFFPAGTYPTDRCNVILKCMPDIDIGENGYHGNPLTPGRNNPNLYCGPHEAPFRALRYYVRVTALYHSLDVRLRGADSNPYAVKLFGSQASVDVTGKAGDVLRRTSARIKIAPNGSGDISDLALGPQSAIQSANSICKRIRVSSDNNLFVDDTAPDDGEPCSINSGL